MKFSEKLFKKLQKNQQLVWIKIHDREITQGDVLQDIASLRAMFEGLDGRGLQGLVIGLAMKTSYEFVVADLLCMEEGAITLPIPLEFSDEQIKSMLSNVDVVFVRRGDDKFRLTRILHDKPIINIASGSPVKWPQDVSDNRERFPGILKIIHTSGTTSDPKGVMIKDSSISILIESLLDALPAGRLSYLSIVPMSLLVEQVFAIYCTLLTDGTLAILPDSISDFGSYGEEYDAYLNLIRKYRPNFMYLAPMLLEEIYRQRNLDGLPKDAFYITGGAKVNHNTLRQLEKRGIIIFEGYGMSETTSVVSINSPTDRKIGTAGRILPHFSYKIVDGELLLKGPSLCAGYFTTDNSSCEFDSEGYLHTGDLVSIDEDHHLTIRGRKKNLIILSNARNISPEWVESKFLRNTGIEGCVVFGDGQETLTAILLARNMIDAGNIVVEVNKDIPSFSRIGKYFVILEVEKFKRNYFTVTGRPKREQIQQGYTGHV